MSINNQTLTSTPSATVIGQLGELEDFAEDYPAARALLIACIRALRSGEPTDHLLAASHVIATRWMSSRLCHNRKRARNWSMYVGCVQSPAKVADLRGDESSIYRQEIEALWNQGASERDIVAWLRIRRHIKGHASTVHRYVKGMLF